MSFPLNLRAFIFEHLLLHMMVTYFAHISDEVSILYYNRYNIND